MLVSLKDFDLMIFNALQRCAFLGILERFALQSMRQRVKPQVQIVDHLLFVNAQLAEHVKLVLAVDLGRVSLAGVHHSLFVLDQFLSQRLALRQGLLQNLNLNLLLGLAYFFFAPIAIRLELSLDLAQTGGHIVNLVLIFGNNGLVSRLYPTDFVLYVLVDRHIWEQIRIDALPVVHKLPVS